MDRRDFLKTTGAAAATVASGAAVADAQPRPAINSGIEHLMLVSAWEPDLPGFDAARLARRIETTTAGRYRVEIRAKGATARADADLSFASAHQFADLHPAFAYFAGLPAGLGFDSAALPMWLAVGGGQLLWDELAAAAGFKPLLAGHTGVLSGLWTNRRFDEVGDWAGARMAVGGLAREVVRALGATPVEVTASDLRAALAEGRIDAAEWLGPLAAASPVLLPLAQRRYTRALNDTGTALSLGVRRSLWERMGAADQAAFEACAAEAYQQSLAESAMHRFIENEIAPTTKWPAAQALPASIAAAVRGATIAALERVAATDEASRRIHDSYQAFRAVLGEPQTV
ncbi:MAG: twin-arginine translocation signal domain-containing protein [Hyphomicrobiaceae bacterium]|nr:MAG: twin-arginine translocation signal domain-containing protein [Hyphomicrobiaceae bacterium]